MIRAFGFILILILSLSLQAAIFSRVTPFSVSGDFILVVVIFFAIFIGREALPYGFLAGLLQDIGGGTFFIHTFSKLVITMVVIYLKENFLGEFSVTTAAISAASTPLCLLVEGMAFFLIWKSLPGISSIILIITVPSIYNGLLAFLFSPLARRFLSTNAKF